MLSPYGKREWLLVLAIGLTLTVLLAIFVAWWAAVVAALATAALLAFFRDPARKTPTLRGLMISPADGRVSSIHQLEHFEPFDGPATCIRIFLSVLDVHVQRSPCHGRVVSIVHKSGKFMNALKPDAADHNESVTMLLRHPTNDAPVAAVRQLVGAIARRIVCGVAVGDILQRGQRYGMIKFGSTVELYLPGHDRHDIEVEVGRYVYGGQTILARTRAETQSDRTADQVVDATEVKV
jgi:phosphatidylserine decarboxylase